MPRSFTRLFLTGTAVVWAFGTAQGATPEKVGASTCMSCHAEAAEQFKQNVHAKTFSALKNIPFEESCETCHGPGSLHAGAAGDKSNPDFATIKNPAKAGAKESSETCLQCHAGGQQMFWKGSKHDVQNVSCAECHSVHSGSGKKLMAKATESETCFQCHSAIKGQINRSAHMPVAEGKLQCSPCHNPHGSPGTKNLKADSANSLCYQCHEDKRGPFLWEHMPVRESCLTCHQPHGSHNDKMLSAKRNLLCQRCHNSTRHPGTLYQGGDAGNQHNRIFNQSCTNCHSNIHGSNHPSGKFFLR